MKRRNVLAVLGSVPLAADFGAPTRAQDAYPAKPVKILVPFGPGGSTDIISRLVGKQLETVTGKPFVVENKPGATGMIGTTQVKTRPPTAIRCCWARPARWRPIPAFTSR